MANNITLKDVLVLDTAADNIIAAGVPVYIYKARFSHPTAAGGVTVTDAGGTVAKIDMAAAAGSADSEFFQNKPLVLNGLRVLAIAAGGVLYIYTAAG